jgi:primosomal protein N' (replication factor Y)
MRAVVVGGSRTAEELGRAFPHVRVRTSDRDGVLSSVGPEPALVVATPGAEPVAEGGYAAALLLDGWALLARADLRAGEEALRRWLNAAALVRCAAAGGVVVINAEPSSPPVQSLVRWDPDNAAERELSERTALRLPPSVRMVALSGDPEGLARFLELVELPEPVDVLGPVPASAGRADRAGAPDPGDRFLIRVPLSRGEELVAAVRAAAGVRSARKEPSSVRIQVDPLEIA